MPRPKLTVARDYDGYFESLVSSWLDEKTEFKHREVVVDAAPWRTHAVGYSSNGETILLEFYSALRTGFGELSEQDVRDLIALL